MSYGGGVHPTGAVVLNLYPEDGAANKIKLGSMLGKRKAGQGRRGAQVDPATGRCPQLVSVVATEAVPVVATALSSAPVAAGRAPRRSPFAAQVAGLTVCRKDLIVCDIMPGTPAYAKRLRGPTSGPTSGEFKLVSMHHKDSPTDGLKGWVDVEPDSASREQPFGLCVSGGKAGCAIDVVLGGIGSAYVVGHSSPA